MNDSTISATWQPYAKFTCEPTGNSELANYTFATPSYYEFQLKQWEAQARFEKRLRYLKHHNKMHRIANNKPVNFQNIHSFD